MLTGLLLLLAHAGRAEGQAAQFHAEYLHHNVYSGGQTQSDSANGVDVSIDGTAFAAVTRNNAGGTKTTARLVMTNDNGTATLNFAATGTGDSAANAAEAGIPTVELEMLGAFLQTGYVAGTYENGMTVVISDPTSTATTQVSAPAPGSGSGAFMSRCLRDSSDGLIPLGMAFAANGNVVEFHALEFAPSWSADTPGLGEPSIYDPNWEVFSFIAAAGHVAGNSTVNFTGHMYLPNLGYRTGTVSHDPTNPMYPTLARSGSSEAGMVALLAFSAGGGGPGGGTGAQPNDPVPLVPVSPGAGSYDKLWSLMLIDGEGDDRILGVRVDPFNGDIVVCGYYSSGNVDFHVNADAGNPLFVYPPNGAISHAGGKDIFVAKYNVLAADYPLLEWVFVHGTSGDDMANAVAIDSDGSVYVAGTTHDPINGVPGDIFVARIKDPPPPVIPGEPQTLKAATNPDEVWVKVYTGTGIDTAEDVTIDHLNRPVFTGQFGYETSGDVPLYFLNFDPAGGSGATVFTHGGSDAYLLRLRPDLTSNALLFDFALAFGDNHDEVGTGVAPNPYNRGELVHCGSFGSSFSTTAYGVDFDPSPTVADIAFTAGKSDPFVNRFDRFSPSTGQAITIMMDVSNSPLDHFDEIFEDLGDRIMDPSVVPHDSSVNFSYVAYSIRNPESSIPTWAVPSGVTNSLFAQCVLPWTTVDAVSAPLIARKLDRMLLPQRAPTEFEDTGLDDALYLTNYLSTTINDGNVYNSACFIADATNDDGTPNGTLRLEAARDWVVSPTSGLLDQVNTLGILKVSPSFGGQQIDREHAMQYACESRVHFTTSVPFEDHLGFANHPDDVYPQDPVVGRPLFQDYLTRFLRRMSHCPGDYDLDGVVESDPQDPFSDISQFLSDYAANVPYADWNVDDVFETQPPFVDGPKFDACLKVGCGN